MLLREKLCDRVRVCPRERRAASHRAWRGASRSARSFRHLRPGSCDWEKGTVRLTRRYSMCGFGSRQWARCLRRWGTALLASVMLLSLLLPAQSPAQAQGNAQEKTQGKESSVEHPTFYRTIPIDGISIFYREAGAKNAPRSEE